MNKPAILSEKSVLVTELFDVHKAVVSYPNGEENIHHIMRRRPSVVVFPLTESYELYLIEEYRYLYKKTILDVPSGFIDKGETSIKAARRELKEEAGITAASWEELARTEIAASVISATVHLFLARDLEIGKPNREAGEVMRIVKISLADAVKKVVDGEITQSTTMTGLLLLDKLHREKKL